MNEPAASGRKLQPGWYIGSSMTDKARESGEKGMVKYFIFLKEDTQG